MLRAVIRILGVLVGLAFVAVAPLLLLGSRTYRPRDLLVSAGVIIIGTAFVRYGVTGKHDRGLLPAVVAIPLLAAFGLLFLAASLDGLFIMPKGGAFSGFVSTIYGVIGVALLWQSVLAIKSQYRRRRQQE